MTKRAFLFAGQGAQKLGMASDLYATYPVVKETFDTASRILGYDLRELIDSNEEKLNQTRYTQPAILTTSAQMPICCGCPRIPNTFGYMAGWRTSLATTASSP